MQYKFWEVYTHKKYLKMWKKKTKKPGKRGKKASDMRIFVGGNLKIKGKLSRKTAYFCQITRGKTREIML